MDSPEIVLFNQEEKKKLAYNFASLVVLQGFVYLFPLITIPYLLQTLGAARYGLIAFGQALIFYFTMFTDYGFNYSATKQIATCQKNKKRVSSIFSEVTVVKLGLIITAFLIYATLILLIPKFQTERPFYFLFFGIVVGQALFPVWLFQGLEKMHLITIIQLIGKLIYTIPIFLIIKSSADYIYVVMLGSISFLAMGLLGQLVTLKYLNIKYQKPSKKGIKKQIKKGFLLFLTNLNTNIYKNINPLLLGIITTNEYVAFYAAAEKIIKAFQAIASPLTQVLYPRISDKVAAKSPQETIRIVFKLAKIYTILLLPCCLVLYIGIDPMISVFFKNSYSPEVLRNIRIMIPAIYLNAVNFLLGVIGLVNLKKQKQLTIFVFTSGVVHIVTTVLIAIKWNDIGGSIGFLVSDIFLFFLLNSYFIWRSKK